MNIYKLIISIGITLGFFAISASFTWLLTMHTTVGLILMAIAFFVAIVFVIYKGL